MGIPVGLVKVQGRLIGEYGRDYRNSKRFHDDVSAMLRRNATRPKIKLVPIKR